MSDISSQQQSLNRRRQLAAALQQQSMLPLEQPGLPGANMNVTQGLARVAQALVAALSNRKLDKEQGALDTSQQAERAAAAEAYVPRGTGEYQVTPSPVGEPVTMERLAGPQEQGSRAAMVKALSSGTPDVREMMQAQLQNQIVDRRQNATQAQEMARLLAGQQGQQALQNQSINAQDRQALQEQQARAGLQEQALGATAANQKTEIASREKLSADQLKSTKEEKALDRQNAMDIALIRIGDTAEKNPGFRDVVEDGKVWRKYFAANDPSKVIFKEAIDSSEKPTADMRNKEAARSIVGRSISTIEELGKKVITERTGIAQKAKSAGRSVDAYLANDPEYLAYKASRFALAGNLAVAQQGSRPSDADIEKGWLPMVPDVFVDTKDSAVLKWSLIKTLSGQGMTGSGQPTTGGEAPAGIDPEDWKYLTPEEKAKWRKN